MKNADLKDVYDSQRYTMKDITAVVPLTESAIRKNEKVGIFQFESKPPGQGKTRLFTQDDFEYIKRYQYNKSGLPCPHCGRYWHEKPRA